MTRSLATTSCTLMPILALLLFGGATLKDFAFALLIGVASGAYSSIFIASPVLTHWKEREAHYRTRRARIEAEVGYVPAYADVGADIEPDGARRGRRGGRITEPDPENVSAAEFEQMKRELGIEEDRAGARHTSTLTKRLARHEEDDAETAPPAAAKPAPKPSRAQRAAKARPAATPPATTQPAATPPATTQPATTQPATTQPATTQPATTTHPATTAQPAPTEGNGAPDDGDGAAPRPRRISPRTRAWRRCRRTSARRSRARATAGTGDDADGG